MTTQTIQSPYLGGLHARLLEEIARANTLAGGLSHDQLNWKPAAKSWSVAECLEHLAITIEFYNSNLRKAIDDARAAGATASGAGEGRHTIAGRLLLKGVNPNSKLKAKTLKTYAPQGSDVAAGILERFTASHHAFGDLMAESDGLDLTRVKLSSPVSGLIRLNGNDAFEVNVDHTQRHLNQAERVMQSGSFPK